MRKTGMLEWWNNGMLGKIEGGLPIIPAFHSSNIPFLLEIAS
jgi:hypothetical protein